MPSTENILNEFTLILRDLLGNDDIILRSDTRRDSVPSWDSFNYLNFIITVESKYGVKFPVSQIETFENVGAIAEAVQKKMGPPA